MDEIDADALDAYIAAAAAALEVEIADDWRPPVRANLATLLEAGRFVTAFELADDLEPAPIFEA